MKKLALLFVFIAALQSANLAQQPTALPTPPAGDDEVVVINTNLVQIDAVVTDKNGKQVTDLKPEDFEILENGAKQEITNFTYINVTPANPLPDVAVKPSANPATADKLLPPVPTKLKPGQVRRTIALVVDDLGLSFESTAFVRQALKKFVDEQMQANDLVAIIRTGGGIGALQQFTSDKRQLYAAIEKVRWNAAGRGGIGAFAPIQGSLSEAVAKQSGSQEDAARAAAERQFLKEADDFRSDVFAVGTLGALNYIISGMRELPGRKAIVLMSDGFRIATRDEDGKIEGNSRILDALRRLTEGANRASVVVNTVDARGLQTAGFTAQDDAADLTTEMLEQRLTDRRNELFDTQEGMRYLASQTGGRSFANNNDIKGSVEKVLDDQNGYYLLGYQPDDAIFDPAKRKFNKLTINVKRPGLKVRYRSGFFGVADAEMSRPAKQTPEQQIQTALTSPFGANDVNLRLNTLFANDAKLGSFIRSLLHVNARDLKFTDEPEEMKKAVFDVVAFTFGDNGVPIDQVNKTYTLRVKNDSPEHRRILEKGFIYYINVPVKKPGAYQLRVALRDAQAEKIGSANQFVEVPNLKRERLTLSGVVLQNMTFEQFEKGQAANSSNQAQNSVDPQTDTALRRFRRDTVLQYAYIIYNAKLDASNRPQLTTQMRLFREGKLVFESKPAPFNLTQQPDMQRLDFGSAISLPKSLELGDYVLQIIVADGLAKEKNRIASQWVEFELIN